MVVTDGPWFKDEEGRTLILRGANLGGSSKVPARPNGATHLKQDFFNHREVSFVGRPFPLEEAGEHFRRLRRWGLTFLRFLVPWEAIEHAGPGMYDLEYLDYLYAVVKKAGEYGLEMVIDPHQDVWSRFCGGDGAPGWTFEAAGMDITQFGLTGAAIVQQVHGDPYPRMIWPSNSGKLAAATMFSLFFGSCDFAPSLMVNGEPIQEFLQRHYIAAFQQVALRLKDLPHVTGYDTMNEPLSGYIGWQDLNVAGGLLKLGESPSPWQSMLLGEGIPQEVELWKIGIRGAKKTGTRLLNPDKARAWLPGYDCVWRQNGVWDYDRHGVGQLLRPDHFTKVGSREVDFNQDYYRPFANRYAAAIRSIDPKALIFIETIPEHPLPKWGLQDAHRIVSAPHWYDSFALFFKAYSPFLAVDNRTHKVVVGRGQIRKSFAQQLHDLKKEARQKLCNAPTLIGEFGIAFDLEGKKAYRNGNFGQQVKALDRTYKALDDNLLSGTIWNYTSDNTNAYGDLWNEEDFSIFSRDQQTERMDIHSGGRALAAVARPYARKIAGEPLRMSFDLNRAVFEFEFRHDPQVQAATEIFVPSYHYSRGYLVEVSDGSYEYQHEQQTLLYRHTLLQPVHFIRIRKKV
jgi:hypothetical protein